MAVCLLFPITGMIADIRRRGRIHPAWQAAELKWPSIIPRYRATDVKPVIGKMDRPM
jgi:hypothetical protein